MKKFITFNIALLLFASAVFAQQTTKLTADDYARAERMLGFNTNQLIDRNAARPTFCPTADFITAF